MRGIKAPEIGKMANLHVPSLIVQERASRNSRGIKAAEADPLIEVVGHVHDEIICLADSANAEVALARLQEHMTRRVEWAPDLELDASGYVSDRYRKD